MNPLYIIVSFFVLVLIFTVLIKKKQNINIKYIFFAFIFAFISVEISIFFQKILNILLQSKIENTYSQAYNQAYGFANIFFNSFISSGLIEEGSKLLIFFVLSQFIYKVKSASPNNKERLINKKQLFWLAIFYGLVFASFENMAYFIQDINSIQSRILTASILHSTIALYYWKFIEKKHKILYFLSAWILHSLYNFFLNINIYFAVFSFIIIVYISLKLYNTAKLINQC